MLLVSGCKGGPGRIVQGCECEMGCMLYVCTKRGF